MILNVDIDNRWDDFQVDLEEVYGHDDVIDEETFAEVLTVELIRLALENSTDFSQLEFRSVEDDENNELDVGMRAKSEFIQEVANFAWHVLDESYSSDDWYKYFSYVDNEGWKWFNFDNMPKIDDEYMQQFEGDYEEYAKEYMENYGESLPEWAVDYFNYEAYGEELVDRENMLSWDGKDYIFTS